MKCDCGASIDVDPTDYTFKLPEGQIENVLAEIECPNPECDRTLFVTVKLALDCFTKDDYKNTKVDWKTIGYGRTVFFSSNPYEVFLKGKRTFHSGLKDGTSINVLYLKSKSDNFNYNLVVEVMDDGGMMALYGNEKPLTPAGFESWTEESMRTVKITI